MSTPSTYAHAVKLGPDGRSTLNFARLVWNGLNELQQRALSGATKSHLGMCVSISETRQPTRAALGERGLLVNDYGAVTPLGVLVRDVGIHTTVET